MLCLYSLHPLMALALTYGSFGDLLETAKLAVKAVKLLRDGASGKLSQERLALATELQTLNSDLITLDFIASAAHLDPSCTRSLLVAIRIRAEAEACRRVLKRFLDKLQAPRGLLGTIIGALSEESELAKFKTEISRPLKAIRTLTTMLNLATSQGLAVQLEDQRRQIGERFDHFGDRLTAYHEAVLNLPVARGVSDDIFCVVDPVGGNIPISLRYCHVYTDLDRIINAYLHNNPEAGSQYVQCGDYHIVSSEGSIITPMEFTQAVRAGTRVEMSIIKRQLHNWRDRQTQNTRCPYCYRNNANQTLNDWFKCANPTCGRKYKINVHDRETEHESGEMEQIMSPQVAYV
ncbi:hypothetical protein FB451DRAFT_1212479 [Mycena latifolia]|nr:hypothetical protein FB451DRAFT_1212479 [Mycena latifolia]